ncbi:MAG: hypothetical protein ABW000_15720 [Actinoplanes sp.]
MTHALLTRIVAALTVASAAAVLAGPTALAVAGGLLLGFVLPGWALLGVFFRHRDLTAVERTVLTPALSMGLLILAGLAVNLVGLPINRIAWASATGGVTLIALLIPVRWPGRPRDAEPAGPADPRPVGEKLTRIDVGEKTVRLPDRAVGESATVVMTIIPAVPGDEQETALEQKARRRRLVRQLLPLALVVAILGGASWLSFGTSEATYDTAVTALSAAPPGPVGSDGNRVVQVSASGLVDADGPYTVTVSGVGATTVRRTVAVTSAGTWTESIPMPADTRMTVRLYRAGDSTAYRTLAISAVD